MAFPSGCPECDIIILSYGVIPGLADTLRHRSLAIEEIYGITAVGATVHAEIVAKQESIAAMLKQANEDQLTILKQLRDQPRA